MAQEIYSIVDWYTSWIAQLVRPLARKAKKRPGFKSRSRIEFFSLNSSIQQTGAQEWHIVPLLGDVTSPTTAVPQGSMTSELRVLSTEKHWPVRRQHTMYTSKSSQCKGEVHSSPVNKQGGLVASQQWMGELKRFPSVSSFAHPCYSIYRTEGK